MYMYFSEFESYGTSIEAAQSFVIVCETKDSILTSSPIPCSEIGIVQVQIDEFNERRVSWIQWNHTIGEVAVIPYDKVESLTIRLVRQGA